MVREAGESLRAIRAHQTRSRQKDSPDQEKIDHLKTREQEILDAYPELDHRVRRAVERKLQA